jgi:hypothetical protein
MEIAPLSFVLFLFGKIGALVIVREEVKIFAPTNNSTRRSSTNSGSHVLSILILCCYCKTDEYFIGLLVGLKDFSGGTECHTWCLNDQDNSANPQRMLRVEFEMTCAKNVHPLSRWRPLECVVL